jgi:hypothetical protein
LEGREVTEQPDNLSGLISAAGAAKMTPEFIEQEIDTRVGKLIVESVDKALRTWSDTGKLIEKAIEDALRVDRLDLPSYGATVTAMLKLQLEATVAPLVAGKLAEDMAELLKLAPKEIKLSEIAAEMLKGREGEYGELITVFVERTEYGSAWIYLDETVRPRSEKHRFDYQLLLGQDGRIASATLKERDIKSTTRIGRSYGIDQRIRAWYACGSIIELDEDYVSVGLGDY